MPSISWSGYASCPSVSSGFHLGMLPNTQWSLWVALTKWKRCERYSLVLKIFFKLPTSWLISIWNWCLACSLRSVQPFCHDISCMGTMGCPLALLYIGAGWGQCDLCGVVSGLLCVSLVRCLWVCSTLLRWSCHLLPVCSCTWGISSTHWLFASSVFPSRLSLSLTYYVGGCNAMRLGFCQLVIHLLWQLISPAHLLFHCLQCSCVPVPSRSLPSSPYVVSSASSTSYGTCCICDVMAPISLIVPPGSYPVHPQTSLYATY